MHSQFLKIYRPHWTQSYLGTDVSNRNEFYDEINRILNLENHRYYSVQDMSLTFKTLKLRNVKLFYTICGFLL
jgi:hypothetical protein